MNSKIIDITKRLEAVKNVYDTYGEQLDGILLGGFDDHILADYDEAADSLSEEEFRQIMERREKNIADINYDTGTFIDDYGVEYSPEEINDIIIANENFHGKKINHKQAMKYIALCKMASEMVEYRTGIVKVFAPSITRDSRGATLRMMVLMSMYVINGRPTKTFKRMLTLSDSIDITVVEPLMMQICLGVDDIWE